MLTKKFLKNLNLKIHFVFKNVRFSTGYMQRIISGVDAEVANLLGLQKCLLGY